MPVIQATWEAQLEVIKSEVAGAKVSRAHLKIAKG
jgi:hypothetical protein